MSANPGTRLVRLPPADFARISIPRTRQPLRSWFRVHPSKSKGICFSLDPTHRFSHPASSFDFLYLGLDIETCLFERFGDTAYDNQRTIAGSLWSTHSLSLIQVGEIFVCDLTNAKTLSALTADLSALMHPDLRTPQAWGLVIQRHPARFQAIKYRSRFNARACVALFKRDGIDTRLRETCLGTLSKNDTATDWLDKHNISVF
jgi:RES domain